MCDFAEIEYFCFRSKIVSIDFYTLFLHYNRRIKKVLTQNGPQVLVVINYIFNLNFDFFQE